MHGTLPVMGVRFGVLAETEQECVQGLAILELLRSHGYEVQVTQKPARLSDDRWMARVTPTAPAGEGQGRGVG